MLQHVPNFRVVELFLSFPSLGAASHLTLGHVASQTTDVILQDLVLVFQFVMVRLDRVNTFGESLERRLEGLGLSVPFVSRWVLSRRKETTHS